MKTIRQLPRVRSLVLATALASLLLMAAMATPAGAQTTHGVFVKDRILELKLGTDANGGPAVIATEHGSYWTNLPTPLPVVTFHMSLIVDGTVVLRTQSGDLSRDPNMPTIITATWAWPLTKGTHRVGFGGSSIMDGNQVPTYMDFALFDLYQDMTVP